MDFVHPQYDTLGFLVVGNPNDQDRIRICRFRARMFSMLLRFGAASGAGFAVQKG